MNGGRSLEQKSKVERVGKRIKERKWSEMWREKKGGGGEGGRDRGMRKGRRINVPGLSQRISKVDFSM